MGDDNVAELHCGYEDRQKFMIIFGKAKSLELVDLKYDISHIEFGGDIVRYTVSETREWGNSPHVELGAKTEIKTSVPFITEGKVEISDTVSNTFNFGQAITTRVIDVPYTATAVQYFEDGTFIRFRIFSMYGIWQNPIRSSCTITL